ncbi:hypothetical protein [Halopiger goleimassiliensis]|uniref:hypothetical protein n=1 Tax=Halopiger goleimassiliensis TaxID=1293048 RepID=UPI0012B528EC|nr:hypothetical protein [Halopiger goleimassiliensis]
MHSEREITPWPFDVVIDSSPVVSSETIDPFSNVLGGEYATTLDIFEYGPVLVIVRRLRGSHLDQVKLERPLDRVERQFDDTDVIVRSSTELATGTEHRTRFSQLDIGVPFLPGEGVLNRTSLPIR